MIRILEKSIKTPDGVKIFYTSTSHTHKTVPLVFLHGFGGDLSAWNPIRDRLSEHDYSSMAIDLRGHGKSDRPILQEGYKIYHFIDDTVEIIQKEKLKDVILIGHCFGGMVAMSTVLRHPEIAKALILINSSAESPWYIQKFYHHLIQSFTTLLANKLPYSNLHQHTNFSQFIGTSDFDIRRLSSDISHTTPRSYLFLTEEIFHFNATSQLSEISIPTLIISGAKDKIFPPSTAQKLHQEISNSKLVILPTANHISVINNPGEIVAEVEKFIRHKKTSRPSDLLE